MPTAAAGRLTGAERLALAAILAYAAYGVVTAVSGFATDSDSARIWLRPMTLLDGVYTPSRTTGFPLYEVLVVGLRGLGAGLTAVNLVTLGIGLGAFAVLWRGLPAGRPRAFAILILAMTPAVFVNASALMETNLALLLAAAYLLAMFRDRLGGAPRPAPSPLAPLPLLLGLALVLTRIDSAILVVAASGARLAITGDRRFLLHLAAVGLGAFAVYAALHGGIGFLVQPGQHLIDDPLPRKLAKAAVGGFAALWTAGAAALAVVLLALPRMGRDWQVLLGIATLLYAARYLMLSDEVEYLNGWLLLVALAAAVHARRAEARLALPVAALGLAVSVSLFVRTDPLADGYALRPQLTAPAWLQEARRRAELHRGTDPAFWEAARALTGLGVAPPIVSTELTGPARREIAVFRNGAYKFLSARWSVDLEARERVVLCDAHLRQTRGWRQLRALHARTLLGNPARLSGTRCTELAPPFTTDRFAETARGFFR
ncbi:hypothetical protein LNKW23_48430 [Paralimibaculum aggregatum]|uniref:Glycosyltransferase RgtA/B/C/D-like domain-containing protein n=1 Tax=Paralimibaculum aggregatum TaxID=3036245 RepID=A0ABQ6LU66_9RHOB|nr:hypothetical protein [Limibaculum sp. NKW23]GMG85620.1 hypothetical protein LNKW23_48430 [Limibaculum sp. NKW23]